GYCFGGLVAFEMAQQLRAQGSHTALIALFSAPLRFNRRRSAIKSDPRPSPSIMKRVRRLLLSPHKALGWRAMAFGAAIRSRLHMATCRLFLSLGLRIPQGMRTMYIVRTLQAAEEQYVPHKYSGRIVLFRGGGLDENLDGPNMCW